MSIIAATVILIASPAGIAPDAMRGQDVNMVRAADARPRCIEVKARDTNARHLRCAKRKGRAAVRR